MMAQGIEGLVNVAVESRMPFISWTSFWDIPFQRPQARDVETRKKAAKPKGISKAGDPLRWRELRPPPAAGSSRASSHGAKLFRPGVREARYRNP